MLNRSSKEQTGMSVRLEDSRTPPWSAASGFRRGLHRTHKSTDEFVINLRADGVWIKASRDKKLARLLDLVNPSGLDLNRFESSARQLFAIFVFFQRACNAPNPKLHTFANV